MTSVQEHYDQSNALKRNEKLSFLLDASSEEQTSECLESTTFPENQRDHSKSSWT